MMAFVYVLMGVSGSGKSSVGRVLAQRLECPFYDGDDFHSPENIAKMSSGIPLDDDDRWTWLDQLAEVIDTHLNQDAAAVLACSALKKSYRHRLRQSHRNLIFIYLRGSFDTIWGRVQSRQDHYMKASMLQSQFNDLEEPSTDSTIVIDIQPNDSDDIDQIASRIIRNLEERSSAGANSS